jgi:hypothetical protein
VALGSAHAAAVGTAAHEECGGNRLHAVTLHAAVESTSAAGEALDQACAVLIDHARLEFCAAVFLRTRLAGVIVERRVADVARVAVAIAIPVAITIAVAVAVAIAIPVAITIAVAVAVAIAIPVPVAIAVPVPVPVAIAVPIPGRLRMTVLGPRFAPLIIPPTPHEACEQQRDIHHSDRRA